MLNESVYVDDVDGAILLRSTVSPIIYKQQIGRALSASKKTNAVILDIVLNINNEEHGNLMIPVKYETTSGWSLGSWLISQQNIYNGKLKGRLTEHQIELLEQMNVVWAVIRDQWERNYQEPVAYYKAIA